MYRGAMSLMRRWHSRSAALLEGAQAKIRASLKHVQTWVGGEDVGTEPHGLEWAVMPVLDLRTSHSPA